MGVVWLVVKYFSSHLQSQSVCCCTDVCGHAVFVLPTSNSCSFFVKMNWRDGRLMGYFFLIEHVLFPVVVAVKLFKVELSQSDSWVCSDWIWLLSGLDVLYSNKMVLFIYLKQYIYIYLFSTNKLFGKFLELKHFITRFHVMWLPSNDCNSLETLRFYSPLHFITPHFTESWSTFCLKV